MCSNPTAFWLCKYPDPWFGNFLIRTRQYAEKAQLFKEYIFSKSDYNFRNYVQKFQHVQTVWLPCGKCPQCIHSRCQSWTLRSSLESQKYQSACVLTLTYDDEHLPENGNLQYKDVQLFIKKLRNYLNQNYKKSGNKYELRYMCACEYGSKKLRPHYHLILFNFFPPDIPKVGDQLKPAIYSKRGNPQFISKLVADLWGRGRVTVGLCNHQTCRYVSQYCAKKLINKHPDYISKCKESPEKLVASVGFGLDWFKRNFRAVLDAGKVVLGGFTFAIPRYFIRKLESIDLKLFEEYKSKMHKRFLFYVFDEEEKRRQMAKSDRILGRFKLFHNKNDVDDNLLDKLHNKYYQYKTITKLVTYKK